MCTKIRLQICQKYLHRLSANRAVLAILAQRLQTLLFLSQNVVKVHKKSEFNNEICRFLTKPLEKKTDLVYNI